MTRGRLARTAGLALLLAIVAAAGFPAVPHPPRKETPLDWNDPAAEPDLRRLRELYLAAVEEAGAIDRGLAEIERLRAAGAPSGSWLEGTLAAYHGALVTLRAKHALWPTAKMRHLREGLAEMDALLRAQPDHAEARYLRLMSCYYLPGILGRNWSVREDFVALARLLPSARDRYPAPVYATITRFVLSEGRLSAEQRRPLEAALARADE